MTFVAPEVLMTRGAKSHRSVLPAAETTKLNAPDSPLAIHTCAALVIRITPGESFQALGADTAIAGGLKNRMLTLDPSFDEANYDCSAFRAFLARLPPSSPRHRRIRQDLRIHLIEPSEEGTDGTRRQRSGATPRVTRCPRVREPMR